ncbi:MAG: DUF2807 domain-containing protein [Prevotella sp.]|nr:DUF2807 domain-containing protein [Prevotella sp.]
MKKYSLLIMAVGAAVLTSCILQKRTDVDPKGEKMETREVPVGSFTELALQGGVEVEYVQGDTCSVVMSGTRNSLNRVQVNQEGEHLDIRFGKQKNLNFSDILSMRNFKLKVTVTCPELRKVTVSGACDFDANGPIVAKAMYFDIYGAGDLDVKNLTCDSLAVMIKGAGDLDLGLHKVAHTRVEISGAGDASIDFDDCDEARCVVSGAGDIKLSGSLRKLDKDVSGAGNINTKHLSINEK